MAVERPKDSAAMANQPAPASTPVVSGAGAPPATAPSRGSAAATDEISSPDAKPAIPEGPYLERQDLSAEDKVKFFDRMTE